MPTKKARINITMPEDIDMAVQKLAKRDHTSLASKTLELISRAIEIEEDATLLGIVEDRQAKVKKSDYAPHSKVWG